MNSLIKSNNKLFVFFVCLLFIIGCVNEMNYSNNLVFTSKDEIKTLNLFTKEVSLLCKDTSTVYLKKIIKLNEEYYIYESLNQINNYSTLRLFNIKEKKYRYLTQGENPIKMGENEIVFFRLNSNGKKLQLFSSDLNNEILLAEFDDNFSIESIVKINDEDLIFLNKDNGLIKFSIKYKTIENLSIKNLHPVFFDKNREFLYCNDLNSKHLCRINLNSKQKEIINIFSYTYVFDEINNLIYFQEDAFSFIKLSEIRNLKVYDLNSETETMVLDKLRFNNGIIVN